MMHERRSASNPDRRKLCGANRPQGKLASSNDNAIGNSVTSPVLMKDADSNREQSASTREERILSREGNARLREGAITAREEQAHVREDAAHGRESTALLREESATSREDAIHEVWRWNMAQQDQGDKLRQVNEQLVISSVQSQILAEEIEKAKVAMTHLANHDFLTTLPNRMRLNDRITQSIASARRHSEKLAVLFLDLDRFKVINDTLGHTIGDQLLQAVAQRLKEAIRSSDTVSRHGGDEFILVLSEVNDHGTLADNVKKIHEIITASYPVAGHDLVIGATIGISIFPQDGEDADTLVRNADAAMYYAKENGRNKYQFFKQEIRARDVMRQHVEASLYQALDKQQFVLFYQAQIDLDTGAISGVEALIRWSHPYKGLLMPADFVSIAEECGAILPIGRWVLREACRQAQSWLDSGLSFNVMAVNIAASEFEDKNFVEHVRSVLQETGLSATCLELELTETVLMKNLACTALALDALRLMGVRISIDDFGTGYSSLSYLRRLPVDTMKIDQSFIYDISHDDDNILINAVICLGKSLHHHVIAEGVETPEQLAFLRDSNCPTVQGFYLNAPMSAVEFSTFLKQGVPAHILN
ncbi:MAG TPA: EAL domain-containing protein [Burkholderiaceae bacterium]|jgi:diguanylate cyclase (GGDEF)-like protein